MAKNNSVYIQYLPHLAYIYLMIPLLLFLIFWITPIVSVPLLIMVLYGVFRIFRNSSSIRLEIPVNRTKLHIIIFVLCLWVIGSGVGGVVWQNRWDHMYRNAIFHDLVHYNWPVINLQGVEPRTLCYYIGFWLPSAAIGKLFGFQVGYFFQLIWASFGVVIAFLLLCEFVKKCSFKVLLIFIFFSGLDIIPYLLYGFRSSSIASILSCLADGAHIELSLSQFNSSSNTTLLFWLYNQTIPFWVGFLLLLRETRNCTRLFTFMLILLFAPFPALALAPLLAFQMIRNIIQQRHATDSKGIEFLSDTFSVENITGFVVSVVIALYFAGNSSAGKTQFLSINISTVIHFIIFLVVEFLVFLPFIFQKAKKDSVFWILFGSMLVFAFIQMGESYDFAWRTSIPAAFYVMILLLKSLPDSKVPVWKKAALVLVLLIGAVTPMLEIVRTSEMTYACYTGQTDESLISIGKLSVFDLQDDRFYSNFIGRNNSIFAKHLQRR